MSQTSDIGGILEDVVHQFSDPFAFFRELVQNSLDAGTGEIDISVDFDGPDPDGLLVASVRDFGCGMNREVIETQLCRLFSSAKHGDLTKIGRFGIGFISVYGIEPDWVCVDTGRDGESWRIIFLPDRSFELRVLRTPFEGTCVRVAKSMKSEDAVVFRERARTVVSTWCAHVRVPVFFGGEDVRQPFELESACAIEFEESGTRAIIGLVEARRGSAHYYNRGLLLQARDQLDWPHVSFKIDSRFLEHTLTRDDLLQDRGYHRVIEVLAELAQTKLPRVLLEELERLAADEVVDARAAELWALLAAVAPSNLLGRWKERRIVPAIGGAMTIAELSRGEPVYITSGRSLLAEMVADLGHRVVLGDSDVLAPLFGRRVLTLEDHWTWLDARSWSEHPGGKDLVLALRNELSRWSVAPQRIWLGRWRSGPAVLACDDPKVPMATSRLGVPSPPELDDRHVVLNESDPVVRAALAVESRDLDIAVVAMLATVDRNRAVERASTMIPEGA